jgi:ParB-like nuclease domain
MATKKTKAKPRAALRVVPKPPEAPTIRPTEVVLLSALKPHPRNYRGHPEDQLAHLESSLRQHGVYKNVVTAKDGTILAGHGIVEAAKRSGMTEFPIIRLNLAPDSVQALKIVAADNEGSKKAEDDDRALAILLQEVMKQDPVGLLGTGHDEQSLAAFLLVTRPASEIANFDAAAEYVGMPEYDPGKKHFKLIVTFASEDDRKRFTKQVRFEGVTYKGQVWSARWPPACVEDVRSVRFRTKK